MIRDPQTLDRVPLAQMSPSEFASYAIVVGVEVNPDPASPRRLMVPPEEASQFEAMREEIRRCVPSMRRGLTADSQAELEDRLLLGLMNLDLATSDALCQRLPGGRPLVIARKDVVDRFERRFVAATAHRGEAETAASRGEPVHEEARAHYRLGVPAQPHAHAA